MRLPLTIKVRAFAETLADGPARVCRRLYSLDALSMTQLNRNYG